MRYSFLIRITCLFLVAIFLGLPAVAAMEDEVQLSADSLDRDQGGVKAEGDVEMLHGETKLHADMVRWDEKTGDVYCEGSVRMTSPEGTATADTLQYNIDTGQGRMTNGRIELPGLAYLSGEEIENLGNDSYKITAGHFTSCAGETPSWSFGANELDVHLGQFAQAKHAKFYIRNVPVLYVPYLVFPAKTDRSSGFLLPSVGFSSRRGTQVELPWYQVIDDDQDVTLTLDYMSRLGLGTGLEYRYFIDTVRPARLNGNYVFGVDSEPDRYLVEWQHDGFLPADTRVVIDVQYVNKDDYFEIFGGSSQEYTSEKVQSVLYLSKLWGKSNLTGLVHYTRALKQEQSTVLQTLPEIGLNVTPQRFFSTPIFTSLDFSATNFVREVGVTGSRFRFYPAVSTGALSSRYLNILPTIAWREQYYKLNESNQRSGRPEASVTVGNRFVRTYIDGDSTTASRHAIELRLNYLYAPEVDTSNIPVFDFRDEFSGVNRFQLMLENRWTGRKLTTEGANLYRDIINLRFLIDYDLYEQRRTLAPALDSHKPFSPLTTDLEIRPHDRVYLRGVVNLQVEDNPGQVESLAVWGGFNDQVGNGLLINYNYEKDEFDYLSVDADLALLSPFYVNYEGRFDLEEKQNLDYRTSLEYRSGCWSISGSWYERPDDRGVSFNFSLSNLTGKMLRPLTAPLNSWL